MHGILLVDKPEGITSAEVVRRVKRRTGAKTGHLGTLDPFASGLLPICLGEGTKIAPFLNQADKAYEGRIQLGTQTDTGDRTGEVVAQAAVPPLPDDGRLAEIAQAFLGERDQVPPMYSAIKRDGRPLYELARQGVSVERAPRRITVHRLELRREADDGIGFSVHCSKGTYVRVLGEEIAAALGTVGHLSHLRRTGFGHFVIEQAVALEAWERGATVHLLTPSEALADLPSITVAADDAARVCQGAVAVLRRLRFPAAAAVKLVNDDGDLIAIASRDGDDWSYARVFQVPG